ncbi:hypothetical protein QJS10_CPA05g02270 [Acorus calamus]|uniref:Uncharacterized protein n=1 Tax=Acorus calamus TaxID=4465 RepID=A0AAV9ETA6_ACOCL|nr:hypothetical protein QJS10_CPA05g02270 [Acorus calamus]
MGLISQIVYDGGFHVLGLSPSLQKKMKEMVYEGGGLEVWVMVFLGPLRLSKTPVVEKLKETEMGVRISFE